MYQLIIERNSKVVSKNEYGSMDAIEEFLHSTHHEKEFDYTIIDLNTGDQVDQGFIEITDDIIEDTMDYMFPDEDSEEGFDWTFD